MTPHAIAPEDYAEGIAYARRQSGRIRAYVSPVTESEAVRMAGEGTRFVAIDAGMTAPLWIAAAYVRDDGYLGGLYSLEPGLGSTVLDAVVACFGAVKLDCLGDGLADRYGQWGFVETFRARWDDDQAPADWSPDYGTPDYIEMERR